MSWITQVNRIREMHRHFLLYLYLLSPFGDVVNQLLPTQHTKSIRQVLPNRVPRVSHTKKVIFTYS